MVSLYCTLNSLISILNRTSTVLHLSCSAWVSVSKHCRPFLSNHFYDFYSFCLWGIIGFKYIIYLSYEIFEFTVLIFCFLVKYGLSHDRSAYLGYYILYFLPLSVLVMTMACTAALSASAATCKCSSPIDDTISVM